MPLSYPPKYGTNSKGKIRFIINLLIKHKEKSEETARSEQQGKKHNEKRFLGETK